MFAYGLSVPVKGRRSGNSPVGFASGEAKVKLEDSEEGTKLSYEVEANVGGKIGWVKETLLSKNISNILNKLKKGEMTKPLKYPNGYLIIKINDKKEMKEITDMDKELRIEKKASLRCLNIY